MPQRFPLREVEPFVEEKRAWIERTLRRMRETEAELPPARLEDGGEVPYLGERLRLRVRVERGRVRAHVARRGDELRVALPPGGDAARRARALVPAPRARRGGAAAGRRLRARGLVATRRCRSAASARAGRRCSSTGAMSFNWRLLLAPAGDPRLRGRARGGPPRGARPLAALLGLLARAVPGLARARALAAPPRARAAAVAEPVGRRTEVGTGAEHARCYSQRKKRTASTSPPPSSRHHERGGRRRRRRPRSPRTARRSGA